MKVTLRQLEVFDAVAFTGSVSEAARKVSLTQSATSMALRDLERQLGCALFHRHNNRLIINERGRRLQSKVRSLLITAGDLERIAQDKTHRGTLIIGASPMVGNYMLPQVCAAFLGTHPEVDIKLEVRNEIELLDSLEKMQIDVAFAELTSHRRNLKITPWRQEDLIIFAPPNHRFAGRAPLYPEALKDEAWCLQFRATSTRNTLMSPILKHIPMLKIVLETQSIEALKGAVRAGIGIGCLSRHAIANELETGVLAELHVTGLDLSRPLSVISHADVELSDMHQEFIQVAMHTYPA